MKKILVVIAAVVLLAGAAFFFYSQKEQGPISIENVLPAKPIFYVRVTNLEQRLQKFTSTKLYNDLKALDYKKLSAQLGIAEQNRAEVEQKFNELFSPENQKLISSLMGRDVAVAVYSDEALKSLKVKTPVEAQKMLSQIAGNIIVATRVAPDVAAAEAVLKAAGLFSKDFKTSTTKYNGKDITVVSTKDGSLTIAYVRFKDILVMGLGDKAAMAAIDTVAKKQKALTSDEEFVKYTKNFGPESDTVGYFDIRPVTAMIQSQVADMTADPKTQRYAEHMNAQLKQTNGLEVLAFANTTADVMTGKAGLYFDKNKVDPAMRALYTAVPDNNRSAKFVPWDVFFYEWGTGLDFPVMWEQYKQQLTEQLQSGGRPVDINKMIGGYEQMLGLSIDKDVLPALGKEFGIYLTDVDTTGNFPIPKMVVYVETTGRDKASAIINKLLALQPNLRPEEETYNGELIRFIPIPFADSFTLGYTFVDNYLLLSSNLDILKASLDAVKDPSKSIAINSALRAADGKKNSIFYVQIDRVMAKAEDIVDWSVKMSKQGQVQRQAFLAGSKKNFDDITSRNETLKADLKSRQNDLAKLEASTDATTDLTAQKDALKKDIAGAEKEIAANMDRAKSLSDQIASYESKAPKDQENMAAMEQIIKPVLKALANIRYFLTVTTNGDGTLESVSQIKIE